MSRGVGLLATATLIVGGLCGWTAAAAATFTRREKPASRALAASISRESRPKPRAPDSPTPSSSVRTCRPPTAARRTLTFFSAIALFHLFVEPGHHHRFDDGQQFTCGGGRDAQRFGKRESGGKIPSDHSAGDHAELPAKTADQVPDLPALMGEGLVQSRGAVGAGV